MISQPRLRALERLLDGLGKVEREFILDWLADHGANPSDDVFIAAATTARLVIELQRASDRSRAEIRGVINELAGTVAAIRTEAGALADIAVEMHTEAAGWRSSAQAGIKAGLATTLADLDSRVSRGVERLSGSVGEPLAPIIAALDRLAALPTTVDSAASKAASAGARAGATAWLEAIRARVRWSVIWRVLAGATLFVALVFAIGFATGRMTMAPVAHLKQRHP